LGLKLGFDFYKVKNYFIHILKHYVLVAVARLDIIFSGLHNHPFICYNPISEATLTHVIFGSYRASTGTISVEVVTLAASVDVVGNEVGTVGLAVETSLLF